MSYLSALLHYNEGRRPHRRLYAFSASLGKKHYWGACQNKMHLEQT